MIARRLYSMLMRLLPRGFRVRYGAQMLQMFEDEWAGESGTARLRLLLRSVAGLLWSALALRVSGEYEGVELTTASRSGFLVGFGSDARASLRALRRRPGFALTAIGTIGLGIGATIAVFSVVDGTVLRGLNLPEQDRLAAFWTEFEHQPDAEFPVSLAELADLSGDVKSFDRVGAWMLRDGTLVNPGDGQARTIDIAEVYGDTYELVGARTVMGRLPGPADDQPGAPKVAVLSHALWRDTYGGRASVIGAQSVAITNTTSALIVGVLAPDVELPGMPADVWVHEVLEPADYESGRSGHGLMVIGRLRDDRTVEHARAEIATLERSWGERYAGQHSFGNQGHTLRVEGIARRMLGTARTVALVLSVATALLLVLACANVANLLLARGESRTAEVGVRLALGSSKMRVARPVLIEGMLISLAGGVIGMLITLIGLPALLTVAPAELSSEIEVGMNWRVAGFAFALSVLTGLVFTIAPSWNAARRDPSMLLRSSGRGRTGVTRGLRILVAGQTALATLLLAGAALLARSMHQLNAVDSGLQANERVTLDLTLPISRYQEADRIFAFYDALMARLSDAPGIERAAVIRHLPLRDPLRRENVIKEEGIGREQVGPAGHTIGVAIQAGSPGLLRTMGIPLVAGRDIESYDRADGLRVALVNQTAAAALWPGQSPVGKRVRATFAPMTHPFITIVGVYGDLRSAGLSSDPTPEVLFPVAQADAWRGWVRNLKVVAHANGDEDAALRAIQSAVRAIDPEVPAENPGDMVSVLRASTARERFLATLLGAFAAIALVIAAVGVFGVVSFTVARQRREFAIRNALGANRLEILALVLRSNGMVAGAGALAGTLMAAAAAPALATFLYQVAPRDALVFTAVPLTLVAIALLSALTPALRATRVAPALALQDGD